MANRLRRTTETKESVVVKFNLEVSKPASFIYLNGIPHRVKKGVLTPLTRVVK